MSGGRQSGEHRKRAAGIARRAARVFPVILLRTGLLRLGAALLVAAAVLLFATTAMGQTVPPVNFNNVPGIPLGFTPGLVAIGDVTGHGNGITDVVMIGTPSGGGITVLPGNGDGTFGTPITSATTTQVTGASGIALADLNGDGAIDVVVLTPQGGLPPSVTIFLNNPASKGSFSAGTSYQIFSLYGGLAGPVYLADINGDGHPDIVLPNVGGTSFVVLLNNGDGTFTASNAQVIQIGGELVALAVGNFTGGTMPDVAVANYNRIVTVWKNTTAARSTTVSFAAQTPAALPAGTDGFYSIAAADFSGNGFTDIAAAVSADNAVYVLDGAGNGTLTYNSAQTVANVPMAYGAQSLTGDFNGDGKPDLALRSGNDGFLVLLNAGGKLQMNLNSSFVVGYGFVYSTSGFAAGALNGNGLTDILGATNNSLSVFFATGNSLTPFGGTLSYPDSAKASA